MVSEKPVMMHNNNSFSIEQIYEDLFFFLLFAAYLRLWTLRNMLQMIHLRLHGMQMLKVPRIRRNGVVLLVVVLAFGFWFCPLINKSQDLKITCPVYMSYYLRGRAKRKPSKSPQFRFGQSIETMLGIVDLYRAKGVRSPLHYLAELRYIRTVRTKR